MPAQQVGQISRKMIQWRSSIPTAFAHQPRDLESVNRWKATKFWLLLLYTGKIVLKKILRQDLYELFMTFNVALAILVCPNLAKIYKNYAKELLQYFVLQGRKLFGPEFLVYNVHCLLHLTKNLQEFDTLGQCSAFNFENYLHNIKRLVHSGKNPLAQIVKG